MHKKRIMVSITGMKDVRLVFSERNYPTKSQYGISYIKVTSEPLSSDIWSFVESQGKPPFFHNGEYITYQGRTSFGNALIKVLLQG